MKIMYLICGVIWAVVLVGAIANKNAELLPSCGAYLICIIHFSEKYSEENQS